MRDTRASSLEDVAPPLRVAEERDEPRLPPGRTREQEQRDVDAYHAAWDEVKERSRRPPDPPKDGCMPDPICIGPECHSCGDTHTQIEEDSYQGLMVRCLGGCGHCEQLWPNYDYWPPKPKKEKGPYHGALKRLEEAKAIIARVDNDWKYEERYATEEALFALTYLNPEDWSSCYHLIHEVFVYMLMDRDNIVVYEQHIDTLIEAFTNLNAGRGTTEGPLPPPTPEPYVGYEHDADLIDAWVKKKPEGV